MPVPPEELVPYKPSAELHASLLENWAEWGNPEWSNPTTAEETEALASIVRCSVMGTLRENPSVDVRSKEFRELLATTLGGDLSLCVECSLDYATELLANLSDEQFEALRQIKVPSFPGPMKWGLVLKEFVEDT